ncbi:N-acetylmuramoyl-L-alanine amidase [Carboxydocella sp. JDF658]|uniref:N-acetylmuramoyl-L-alanine amidase n=1 Tax=Carboxydocella sp. JDF658 TaxID=1926600 RepID=UPI0009AE7E31|nr:N-acetylmuramoyl-L-alanine amidase [Carboxydocella sp. JDF658]
MKKRMLSLFSCIMIFFILFGTSVQSAFAREEKIPINITIFYLNGDWMYQPVSLKIDYADNPYLSALNLLVNGYNLPIGCYKEFPDGVKINSFKIKGNTAYVDINKFLIDKMKERNLSTDVLRDILSYNIFSFDSKIKNISFTFDGTIVDYFSTMSRDDYFKVESKDQDKKIMEKIKILSEQFKGKTPEQIREIIKKTAKEKTSNLSNVSAVATYKVCVDPGHGGSDSGAVGKLNGVSYYEKDINLSIALWLQAHLEADGISVIMTRTTDKYVDLTTRYTLANNNAVNCFVSVHHNSSTNTSARGTTVIYPNNHHITESSNLALEVHNAVLWTTSLPEYTPPYKDVRNLAVLRNTKMPAIITETGFMSNSTDLTYLINSLNQESIGAAIELGIYWWLYYY